MKKILTLLFLCFSVAASAQIDTANYLTKPVPAVMRTDTLATNLLTYNQTLHRAELMSGLTLKNYFQKNIDYTTLLNKPVIPGAVSITAGNGILVTGSGTVGSPYVISVVQPTISFPTRTVNTSFTPSATKASYVYYTVTCSATNPLLAGSSTATVSLQYSTNGGTTWNDYAITGNSSAVGLAVAIQLTNGQSTELSGLMLANWLVQIKSVNTGTASSSVTKSVEAVY